MIKASYWNKQNYQETGIDATCSSTAYPNPPSKHIHIIRLLRSSAINFKGNENTWNQIESTHLHEGRGRNGAVQDSQRALSPYNRQGQPAPAIPGGGREGPVAVHAGRRARGSSVEED